MLTIVWHVVFLTGHRGRLFVRNMLPIRRDFKFFVNRIRDLLEPRIASPKAPCSRVGLQYFTVGAPEYDALLHTLEQGPPGGVCSEHLDLQSAKSLEPACGRQVRRIFHRCAEVMQQGLQQPGALPPSAGRLHRLTQQGGYHRHYRIEWDLTVKKVSRAPARNIKRARPKGRSKQRAWNHRYIWTQEARGCDGQRRQGNPMRLLTRDEAPHHPVGADLTVGVSRHGKASPRSLTNQCTIVDSVLGLFTNHHSRNRRTGVRQRTHRRTHGDAPGVFCT